MRKLNDHKVTSYRKRKASSNLPKRAKIPVYYMYFHGAAVSTRLHGWCLNPEAT